MVVGILLYVKPQQHVVWGVLVIVFSVVSLFYTLGGFIIGLILGLIGGILGAVWKPPAPMAPGMMQPMPPNMPPQSNLRHGRQKPRRGRPSPPTIRSIGGNTA